MKESITDRMNTLIDEGKSLERSLPGGSAQVVLHELATQYQAWISSAINLIELIAIPSSNYLQEVKRIQKHEYWKYGVPAAVFQQTHGLLISAKKEWEQGLMRQIEYIVAAETFDEFLDHAARYHKGNKKIEAAVLASAVLEDTVKKIATKNDVDPSGKSLDELIDELSKTNVITPIKAKRYKSYSGVRNSALHAEWDQIDIKDVGEQISGIREMIEQHLS